MALSISFRRRANTSITIYNKYLDGSGNEVYQRTQIIGPSNTNSVIWNERKAANVIRSGLLEADSVSIVLPTGIVSNYVAPITWQALVSKTGKFTIQQGDYIVKGLVTDEITGGFTIDSLNEKYESVLMVTSVDLIDQGRAAFQHWQIGAK